MTENEEDTGGTLADATRAGLVAIVLAAALRPVRRLARLLGRRMRAFALGLLVVLLSVTTCSFGVDPASLTASYGPPVAASAQDALGFVEKGGRAVEALSGSSTLRISVTEAEATSALSLGMMLPELMTTLGRIPPEELRAATDLEVLRERVWRESQAVRDSLLAELPWTVRVVEKLDPRLRTSDVQVRFQESGKVVVSGAVHAWTFRQPLMFVVAPSTRSGELELDFVEGRLGRLPAPAFLFGLVGDAIARAVLLGREYAEVLDLTVAGGTVSFEGRIGR
jgi:hypothetical protein